jgi:hypothetical protein
MVKFEKDNDEDDLKENKKEVLTGAIKALRYASHHLYLLIIPPCPTSSHGFRNDVNLAV